MTDWASVLDLRNPAYKDLPHREITRSVNIKLKEAFPNVMLSCHEVFYGGQQLVVSLKLKANGWIMIPEIAQVLSDLEPYVKPRTFIDNFNTYDAKVFGVHTKGVVQYSIWYMGGKWSVTPHNRNNRSHESESLTITLMEFHRGIYGELP
jgi:hypothetical protein